MWGAFTVTVFVLLDMLDGALARARGGGSVFGAVLDSTGDRAADAAIFGALVWWFSGAGDNRLIVLLALLCLVLGVLTSYIKARAEGVGLSCDVGVVERTERLILVLVGTGFTGLGIPYALHVALWVLLVGSAITVGQRFLAVRRAGRGPARAARAMSDAAAVPAASPSVRPRAAVAADRPAHRRRLRRRLAGGEAPAGVGAPGRRSTAPGAGRPAGTARACASCGPTCGWSPADG